jgi:hypothetical protein
MAHITLDQARLVMLQFSFSNPGIIPDAIRKREPESKNESTARKARQGGILAIEQHENTNIAEFVKQLSDSGYVLVDGFYQARQDVKNPKQMYHVVRFTFAKDTYAEVTDEFKEIQPKLIADLRIITTNAFWRARAFSNPFYKDGEEVAGFTAPSFNFEARVPRFLPDGKPVTARRKDATGKKIGDPVPLEPAGRLVIKNETVTIIQ